MWEDPLGGGPPARAPLGADAEADADDWPAQAAEGETVLLFYRVDDGETLGAIGRRFGIKTARIVADNRLDPQAKLQKGMLLKLHVPRASLSRLASERPLDDAQYAAPVPIEAGSSPGGATLTTTRRPGASDAPVPRSVVA